MKKKKILGKAVLYLTLILLGMILVFPLVYMFFGTFKSNQEIFGSLKILPENFNLEGYQNGWKGSGQIGFGTYL